MQTCNMDERTNKEKLAGLIPKGWNIEYNPKPIPARCFDWDFWHEDNDIDGFLCGTGNSFVDCVNQIKDINNG